MSVYNKNGYLARNRSNNIIPISTNIIKKAEVFIYFCVPSPSLLQADRPTDYITTDYIYCFTSAQVNACGN